MILIALFCNLMSLCVLKPHSKMLLLKCGAISELYMILRVYFGRKCFILADTMERTGGRLGACENIERNKALIGGKMIQVVLSGANEQGRSRVGIVLPMN